MVKAIGMMPLGHKAIIRTKRLKQTRENVYKRAEIARDQARLCLLKLRQKLKLKFTQNETEMRKRKQQHVKSLNPTARYSTMARWEWGKLIRNTTTTWSSVPLKPKYSRITPRPRVYGKRFKLWEGIVK